MVSSRANLRLRALMRRRIWERVMGLPRRGGYFHGWTGWTGLWIGIGRRGFFGKSRSFPLISVHLSRTLGWDLGVNGGGLSGFGGDIGGFGGPVRGFGAGPLGSSVFGCGRCDGSGGWRRDGFGVSVLMVKMREGWRKGGSVTGGGKGSEGGFPGEANGLTRAQGLLIIATGSNEQRQNFFWITVRSSFDRLPPWADVLQDERTTHLPSNNRKALRRAGNSSDLRGLA